MSKLSVIIPSRNSPFAIKTVEDILAKSKGEIEVFINIDEKWPVPHQTEYWSTPALIDDDRVTYLHPDTPQGMRAGINACLSRVTGEYIMKCDDHCLFDEGFDVKLMADMEDNWLVIPRRHSLDAERWCDENNPKGPRDYHYLCYPEIGKPHDSGMHGVEWRARTRERLNKPEYDIDDTMSFQGSCWFANRKYFMEHVGFMDDRVETYSTFAQEPQEIGLKYWLGGGFNKVNKKTWYAHLHKGKRYGRMYKTDYHTVSSHNWSGVHWMNNDEPNMIHPLSWLVEKFWKVPTWPDNYKELC